MSIEISKHSPPDEKQVHFAVDENSPQKEDNASQSDEVLRTDEPAIAETQPPKVAVEVENKESSPSSSKVVDAVAVNGESDAISEAIEKRKQPLMELAYSEESYVKRLRVAFELYMPAPYRTSQNIDPNSTASVSPTSPGTAVGFEELASKLPPGGPSVPEDLVARWRILWGNWMQLFEWHTGFYEKLKTLLEEDPDRIPKLFIDSRARLRSIYSKYCENQIKAAHIAEQHKDFFDEWRVHVGDKEDVLSLLMQPVQRIMRYQLPISEIVKWTERAKLPSLPQWQKALDIMKEIPKDTQLILEAARIDGFPGVITALGTLRIRGDLLVASLSCCELADALRSYAKALNIIPSNPANRNSSAISLLTKLHLQSSSTPDDEETIVEGGSVGISTNEPALPSPSVPRPHLNRNPTNTSVTAVEGCEAPTDLPPPLPGGQKFVVSRLFLFDRMLLVTEEVKAKRKGTSADAFAQSTYQFRAAVNVNKMKFEPHWFMCNVMSESDAGEKGDLYTNDWIAVRSALELAAADDLRFALWDQTPGRDVVYIIDPQTVATRSAWVVHLRDIQRMQQQLLMALEEPTRFAGGDKDWGSPPAPTTEMTTVRSQQQPKDQAPQTPQPSASQTRKWPSFTMRRPGRLSSTSSSSASAAHGPRGKYRPITPGIATSVDSGGGSLLRSFSAERHRVVTPTGAPTPSCTVDPATPVCTATGASKPFVVRSASSPHRKPSDDNSRYFSLGVDRIDSTESAGPDPHRNSVGFQKTKKVFTNLFFGKHSKKARSPATTPTAITPAQHPSLPPPTPSVPTPRPTKNRSDQLPPPVPHPTSLGDVSDCS